MKYTKDEYGFTLLEVLIALVITLMVTGAAVMVFSSLQHSSTEIDQRTNLSANARGAMFFIEDHIKLLGFNPSGNKSKNTIMRIARGGMLEFEQNDPDDSTNLNDIVKIALNASVAPCDADGNGLVDVAGEATSLVVNSGNVADNVVAIGFAYGFDRENDGDVDTDPATNGIIWAVDTTGDGFLNLCIDTDYDGDVDTSDSATGTTISPVSISKIRAVKVWLLVRSKYPVRGETDNNTYCVGINRVQPNDSYAHVLHTTAIRCRNMF